MNAEFLNKIEVLCCIPLAVAAAGMIISFIKLIGRPRSGSFHHSRRFAPQEARKGA